MALALVAVLVVGPLILLFADLLHPKRRYPGRYAGPPTGRLRPVPRSAATQPSLEPEHHDQPATPDAAPIFAPSTLVTQLPPAVPLQAAPSAVRAPIAAGRTAASAFANVGPSVELTLPAAHLEPRPVPPGELLASVPATAGVVPAAELPPRAATSDVEEIADEPVVMAEPEIVTEPVPEPVVAAEPAERVAEIPLDTDEQAAAVHAAFATLAGESPEQVRERRLLRSLGVGRAARKGPFAPTGGRRDFFGDGLLAGTVAERSDAA